jgi:hypothetical protein
MDIWRIGLVSTRASEILETGIVPGAVRWAEEKGSFRFLADPFGVARGGQFYVFAEAYDYRSRLGRIDALIFDQDLRLAARETCLAEPWHLSYPVPLTWRGEQCLLPEAHRSGRLSLYRAIEFPLRWERCLTFDLPHDAIDATPFYHDGLWWLFYGRPGIHGINLAFAENLDRRWRLHPASPISSDASASRPGGLVVMIDESPVLHVQDCSETYGGGLRPLILHRLDTKEIEIKLGEPLRKPWVGDRLMSGMHTLSACGDITLIDAKHDETSLLRLPVDALGRTRRAVRKLLFQRPRSDRR